MNKKLIMLTIAAISLFAVSAVSAADNATYDIVSMKDAADEAVSVENDFDILSTDKSTYSTLVKEIGSGGNIKLKHAYYTYDKRLHY